MFNSQVSGKFFFQLSVDGETTSTDFRVAGEVEPAEEEYGLDHRNLLWMYSNKSNKKILL